MKMQTRRHSHKSELAWKKTEEVQEVRYWFPFNCEECGVLKTYGAKSYWMNEGEESVFLPHIHDESSIFIEVTASDLPYLEKPEGEWEFRKVVVGDSFFGQNGQWIIDVMFPSLTNRTLSGYRWCAPRKVTCPHCNGTGEI